MKTVKYATTIIALLAIAFQSKVIKMSGMHRDAQGGAFGVGRVGAWLGENQQGGVRQKIVRPII